jgi:cytosine/adenosine deaminase-related metal-dependent hydrolase
VVLNGGAVSDLLLSNVRPWARALADEPVDVVIRGGRIAHIGAAAAGEGAGVGEVVDGAGGVVVPAFADAHTHLDSTLLGLPFRSHTAGPGLAGLIENDRRNWRQAGESVAVRATRTLGTQIAYGTTLVRSHAQIDTDAGLERLEGVLAAREAHAGRCRVQVVAFPQSGILRDPGTADLLGAALRAGADLVGGLDPCEYDRDPVAHLDTVFAIAEHHHSGIDIHLHEAGELGAFTIELIAERARALAMQGQVTISHAFALATVDTARQGNLIDTLADLDIAITTVAPGNRAPLPLAEMRAAGVRVGLGQDGIRDYWSPYGTGDMLSRTWQLAYRAGYRHDHLIEGCVDVATRGGRACIDSHPWSTLDMLDDPIAGLAPGAPADLVLLGADTVTAAVMEQPTRSIVLHQGRVIARDGTLT